MSKEDEAFNYLTTIAIFMGVSLFVVLLILLITKTEYFLSTYGNLLSALFILLASGIASASVMKSIKANKTLDEEKNLRLQKRNSSILKAEIKNLEKEIQTQSEFLEIPIFELSKYKYSEKQTNERLFRVVEKITNLDINEYNSSDTIDTIIYIQRRIYDRIHEFEVLFKLIDDLNKIDETVIKFFKDMAITNYKNIEDISQLNIESELNTYNSQNETNIEYKSIEKTSECYIDASKIIEKLKKDLKTDKKGTNILITKL